MFTKFLGQKCTGGKLSKKRITVLFGANMSGSQKLPLLTIGKSKNPRCFKNQVVPLNYRSNDKAWMTGNVLVFSPKFLFKGTFSTNG